MGACLIQEKPEIRLDCLGNGYGFGLSIFLRKGLIVAQAGRDLTVQSGLSPNSQRYSSLCLCLPSAGNRFFVLLTRLLVSRVWCFPADGCEPRGCSSHGGCQGVSDLWSGTHRSVSSYLGAGI